MKQRRVYIIEDSLTIRALLQALVERDERLMLCGVATSAEDALAEMDVAKPDIILLNLDLPGMQGLRFMERMEAEIRDPWYALRIIVVSGSATRDAPICAEAFARGAAACFDMALGSARSEDLLALLRFVASLEDRPDDWQSPAVTLPPSAHTAEEAPELRHPSGPLTFI